MNGLSPSEIVIGVLTAIGGVIAAWATFFRDKGNRATTIVDQWEALAKEAETRRKDDKAELLELLAANRLEALEALAVVNHRLDQSVERETVFYEYTRLLRNHIMNGSPPPPPQWPRSLMARFPDE